MQSVPAADTMEALSEQCTPAMDMDGAALEGSLPGDVAALAVSVVADSEAVELPEVFD